MTHSSKYRVFGQSSRFALAVALAIPGAVALPAVTHAQEAAQDISISAGDLGAALQRYSAATGVQLVYSSDLVAGKRSSGVSGRMSPQQALGQLLAGTGLSARVQGNTATLVQGSASGDIAAAEGERLLGPVRVEGSQGGSYQSPVRGQGIARLGGVRGEQDDEAVGYRVKVAAISTGTPVAIEDIPRSITVQTQEQLGAQDITTIGEALQRMPGVAIVEGPLIGSEAGAIYVRGEPVQSIQVDGGVARPLALTGNGSLNLDAYERVELVRGPNGLFSGAGSTGGSINLVRKRPGNAPAQEISLDVGSYNRVGAIADISTPSFLGSGVGFRGVASIRREEADYDNYKSRNMLLSGLFDIPLGEGSRLELSGSYNELHINGGYLGLDRYVEGPLIEVPRKFNPDIYGYTHTKSLELSARLYTEISPDWMFQAGASVTDDVARARIFNHSAAIRQDGSVLYEGRYDVSDKGKQGSGNIGLDARLTGKFGTFGLTHNVFLSAFYNSREIATDSAAFGSELARAPINSLDDYINPVFGEFASAAPTAAFYNGDVSETLAFVVGDTISWRNMIDLTLSFRRDMVYRHYVQAITAGGGARFSDADVFFPDGSEWRPSYSLAVKPFDNLTLYASYADSFQRNDDKFMRSGTAPDFIYVPLGPTIYKNKEIGAKYATSNWVASIAAYDYRAKNAPQQTGVFECPPTGTLGSPCYTVDQATKNQGIEAEIAGDIFDNLGIIASASYSRTRRFSYDTPDAPLLLPSVTQAPTKAASLFLNWKPGFAQGASLQFGARYRGRVYQEGLRQYFPPDGGDEIYEVFQFAEKPYVVFDLGGEHRFSDGLQLKLFVENIFDKKYLSTVSPGTGNFYGKPRSFMASVTWKQTGSRMANGDRTPFGRASDWYAAIDAGVAFIPDIRATAEGNAQDGSSPVVWNFETGTNPTGAVRLGYHAGDNARVELELAHRESKFGSIGGNAVAPFGVCDARAYGGNIGDTFKCDDVPGKISDISLMLNGLYDFGARDADFRPFIGGGVGLSRHSVGFSGKMDGIGGDTAWVDSCCDGITFPDFIRSTTEFVGGQDTSISLAFQAVAGASIKLGDRLSVDAAYRYFNVPGMKWSTYNLVDLPSSPAFFPPLTPPLVGFKADYESHTVTIGLRWAFGSTK